jgi:P-type Cu+ transporter
MLRAMALPAPQETGMARDPVCGMTVDPATASEKLGYQGTMYYFCSAGCRSAFEKDPERYLAESGRGHHAH